ncbi:MAG TPA: alpha-E domain-containing protein, partial [Verrucomicrobiae bacterium]
MLSRVANSLFWMSRYVERAENVARLLDVNLQLLLDYRSLDDETLRAHWMPIVQTTGDEEAFGKLHEQATAASVSDFMVFNMENSNSILSSICQARENARMIRDQITIETWEELNRLYLFMRSPEARKVWQESPTDFFNQVKASSLQLLGLSYATHSHNEGWWFSEAGRFMERADKTSRILDLRHQTLPARGLPKSVNQTDALEWSAVLRSCSGWDVFKSIYGAEVHPKNVAQFLLLNEDFPRSIRYCVERLNKSLRQISGVADHRFSNEAEKLCGRLTAELQFISIEEVFEFGLHDYLDQIQLRLNQTGNALFNAYIFQSYQLDSDEHLVQQEEQQQQASTHRRL